MARLLPTTPLPGSQGHFPGFFPQSVHVKKVNIERDLQNRGESTFSTVSRFKDGIQGKIPPAIILLFSLLTLAASTYNSVIFDQDLPACI